MILLRVQNYEVWFELLFKTLYILQFGNHIVLDRLRAPVRDDAPKTAGAGAGSPQSQLAAPCRLLFGECR
jgi:hypothetical protein